MLDAVDLSSQCPQVLEAPPCIIQTPLGLFALSFTLPSNKKDYSPSSASFPEPIRDPRSQGS
jgi:hypothetical protein